MQFVFCGTEQIFYPISLRVLWDKSLYSMATVSMKYIPWHARDLLTLKYKNAGCAKEINVVDESDEQI